MHPHHPLVLPLANDLIARRALVLRIHHGVIHRRETRLIYLHIRLPELLHRLRLREADAPDFRMREHHRGDVRVIEFRVLVLRSTEKPIPELAARGDGDGREFNLPAHVAQGVDVFDRGVLVVIGYNLASLVLLDAGFVEAEVFDFGGAADGPEEAVEIDGGAVGGGFVFVVELHPARSGVDFLNFGLRGVAVDVDTLALVFGNDRFLDHWVEGSKEGFVADEEMGFASQVVEHPRHFDGDVACADEGDALGEGFEVEEAIGRDAQLGAGNVFGDIGMAAGSEKDLFGADDLFCSIIQDDFCRVLVEKVGTAVEVLDFVVVEISFVDAVQTLDVVVSFVLEGLEVEWTGLFDLKAVGGGFVEGFGDSRGVPGHFLGDAAAMLSMSCFLSYGFFDVPNVDAGASQPVALNSNGLSPPLPACFPGTRKTSAPTTNNEKIAFPTDRSHG